MLLRSGIGKSRHFAKTIFYPPHTLFTVPNRYVYILSGKEYLAKGKEFHQKDNLEAALRELKRAKISIDDEETNETTIITKAETYFELGEVTYKFCERKMVADRSEILNHGVKFDYSVNYTKAYNYYLMALELFPKHFIEKRVLCWQRTALLQMKINRRFEKCLRLIKNGFAELTSAEELIPCKLALNEAINLILKEQLQSIDYHPLQVAIMEMVDIQIDLICSINKDMNSFLKVFLNAMRLAHLFGAYEYLLKFWNNFQVHFKGAPEMIEGNLIIIEAKQKFIYSKRIMGWYLGNRAVLPPERQFPTSLASEKLLFLDLGEPEALRAVKIAESLGSDLEIFVTNYALIKIYLTKRILKTETKNLLGKLMNVAEKLSNDYLNGLASFQYGLFYYIWDEYSDAEHYLIQAESLVGNADKELIYEIYSSLIVLHKQMKLDEQVEYYYKQSIELFTKQHKPEDREWEILLGYAVWLLQRNRLEEAQQAALRTVDIISEVFSEISSSILRRDRIGPFMLLYAILLKITAIDSDVKLTRTLEKIQSSYVSLKTAFPEAQVHINELKMSPVLVDEYLSSVSYPAFPIINI